MDIHQKGELAAVLRGLGLSPAAFDALIEEAVRFDWTPEEFEARLYLSKPFQRAFPGILREDGSLRVSPLEYRQIADAHRKVAANYGIPLDATRIGLLFQENKSPDEFEHIAQVYYAAKNTEEFRHRFNEQLKAEGEQPLGTREWFEALAGKADAKVLDVMEAARLRTAGFDLTTEEAMQAARRIGAPGEEIDSGALIEEIQKQKQYIGSELAAAGITDADLAVIASGEDPKNQRQTALQILRNRQALSERPVAVSRQRTPAGRAALHPEFQETA